MSETLRHRCRNVRRTLRHRCQSVLMPKCPYTIISVSTDTLASGSTHSRACTTLHWLPLRQCGPIPSTKHCRWPILNGFPDLHQIWFRADWHSGCERRAKLTTFRKPFKRNQKHLPYNIPNFKRLFCLTVTQLISAVDFNTWNTLFFELFCWIIPKMSVIHHDRK